MSRFYGVVKGAAKTEATRRGHNVLTTTAATWQGAVHTTLWLGQDNKQHYKVELVPWKGQGKHETLAAGMIE